MALQPYQLAYNGLTLGAGTDIQLVSATGLRDLPAVRNNDTLRPRALGAYGGLSYMGERTVTLQLLVMATKQADWETVLQQVAAAFQPVTDPSHLLGLQVQLPGWSWPLTLTCRPTRYSVPIDTTYAAHKATVHVELVAPDPRWYGPSLTASTGLSNPTTGARFPWAFPLSWGTNSGGQLVVANAGTTALTPVFTIQGPCTNPWIELGSSRMTFGITLASSDSLAVDTDAHTITLNGTASRYNTLQPGSVWFACPPGTSTVRFGSGDSTVVAATCSSTYAPAYASI